MTLLPGFYSIGFSVTKSLLLAEALWSLLTQGLWRDLTFCYKGYLNFSKGSPVVSTNCKQMPILWSSNFTPPGISLREMTVSADQQNKTHKIPWSRKFAAASFIIAPTWKWHKCPSGVEMENKFCCAHRIESSTAMEKEELLVYAATWITLPCVMVKERSQTEGCKLYMMFKMRLE